MKQYSDKEMSDMNCPKWLVANGKDPGIDSSLIIDIIGLGPSSHYDKENIGSFAADWKTVFKYRLRNSPAGDGYPAYKDGIAIEQKTDKNSSINLPIEVGTEFTIKHYNDFRAGHESIQIMYAGDGEFRAIDDYRRRVIEAAAAVIQDYEGLYKLYDAGFLSMPEGDV